MTKIGRPRSYTLNERYFQTLTDDSAYLLGLIQADGSVEAKRHRLRITLKGEDREHLHRVARLLDYNGPLPDFLQQGRFPAILLAINSVTLVSDLSMTWGIRCPKSSCTVIHPDLAMNRHYWRGVIDGDGTLCTAATGTRIVSLVGHRELCSAYLRYIRTHGYGMSVNVNQHRFIWSVQVKSRQAEGVAALLYADTDLAIPRKLSIYQSWVAP